MEKEQLYAFVWPSIILKKPLLCIAKTQKEAIQNVINQLRNGLEQSMKTGASKSDLPVTADSAGLIYTFSFNIPYISDITDDNIFKFDAHNLEEATKNITEIITASFIEDLQSITPEQEIITGETLFLFVWPQDILGEPFFCVAKNLEDAKCNITNQYRDCLEEIMSDVAKKSDLPTGMDADGAIYTFSFDISNTSSIIGEDTYKFDAHDANQAIQGIIEIIIVAFIDDIMMMTPEQKIITDGMVHI
ncbi:MAG: hypothetical protein Satyrvirus7_14 [Satyrvirus sp.]|uniref:Uncharacterized protein n=1 Tax=Satyrvirus sp. TaxID=2487771 RepID=A0A3G5ADG9_9VIRU|nr:MAG: hypothetical protein Satyrvirus7_14 [Satyrvirus sp.]